MKIVISFVYVDPTYILSLLECARVKIGKIRLFPSALLLLLYALFYLLFFQLGPSRAWDPYRSDQRTGQLLQLISAASVHGCGQSSL